MKIVITGGTGFLGRPLVEHLSAIGHECIVLSRDPAKARSLFPSAVQICAWNVFPQAEAVIHLAGENVVGWWTPQKRRAILNSRVESTRSLVTAIRWAKTPPHTLLVASAVGIYGNRPGEILNEAAPPDPTNGFRAQVCQAWESAATEALHLGTRVVPLRIGNVMRLSGGFLGGLLPVYRSLGPWILGRPEARIPWISMLDAVSMIAFALENSEIHGPLNVVAPYPITQQTLATTLAPRLGHTVRGRIPGALLRGVLGEFSRAILDDQNVVPEKALEAGFKFAQPAWRACLDDLSEREILVV